MQYSDAYASGLGPCSVAREQDHARPCLGKHFGNRLANAHRSARNHHNLPDKFHARVVFPAARQVKVQGRIAETSRRV